MEEKTGCDQQNDSEVSLFEHEDCDDGVKDASQQEGHWLHKRHVMRRVQPQTVEERPVPVGGLDLVRQPDPELGLDLDRSQLELLVGFGDFVFVLLVFSLDLAQNLLIYINNVEVDWRSCRKHQRSFSVETIVL